MSTFCCIGGKLSQWQCVPSVISARHTAEITLSQAAVPCYNKIILKNFRPEPPPSVDRAEIVLFQAWFHHVPHHVPS